jgi:hypothetical protein
MQQWNRIELTNQQVISQVPGLIQSNIHQYIKVLNNNKFEEVAIFSEMTPDTFYMYFSPKIVGLMKFVLDPYKPQPCPEPVDSKYLQFIFGDPAIAMKILRGRDKNVPSTDSQ